MRSPDLAQGIGTLLRADAARIHAVASRFEPSERYLVSTVEGGSMGTTLPAASRIRIELDDRGSYEPGEIIAYVVRGQVIVHRVVYSGRFGAASGHLLARGDATVVPDPPVPLACILGPVSGVWRDGAWAKPFPVPSFSWRSRMAANLVFAASRFMLALSPRLAESGLMRLHRAERFARAAVLRSRQARPRRTI